MKIHFKILYFTHWGQKMFVSGNIDRLGNGDLSKAFQLSFQGHEDWVGTIEYDLNADEIISYKYVLFDESTGKFTEEWGNDRKICSNIKNEDYYCVDKWNNAGSIENAFMTSPFRKVLLKGSDEYIPAKQVKSPTHKFIVKAPFLQSNQALCLIGNCPQLGDWKIDKPQLMNKSDDLWELNIDLHQVKSEIYYKYGIYDMDNAHFLYFEQGPDRYAPVGVGNSIIQVNDGFIHVENQSWHGAGVGLPVFSIRTKRSFGVGDFADIKLFVDWASKVGLKLIQVLPLNDTTGSHTELDVLPYAAISAFALNPLFLNLPDLGKLHDTNFIKQQYKPKQTELNALPLISFLEVINFKLKYAKEVYLNNKAEFLNDSEYKAFFEKNAFWLIPYAAYCVLRDRFGTNDYRKWDEFSKFDEEKIAEFTSPNQPHFDEVAVNYFIQYHLDKQLREAGRYAHEHGIVLKGDIPISVNKNSVDTWVQPELFHMDMNAGAPPDMFAIKGQNWLLPTYNWDVMKLTEFKWWKQRFEQMSNYFDTFRIDHILGFFRIWEIPVTQVEGIMGHLNPSIPIFINEFGEKGIWFDYNRFCKPYITDQIIQDFFGEDAEWVKTTCLDMEDGWILRLKPEFLRQSYVDELYQAGKISERIKYGLFDLISNVLLFEVEGSDGTQFYPRYAMHYLRSYAELDEHTKKGLDELYIHYYYHRQDDYWYNSGMDKLPALKRSTNMLICGEDLGMMNPAVTAVMKELGILSLEIQRAPKTNKIKFAHPNNAPYLSVVTPSTHDMSTIRGWWEEDREATQRFYNEQLGHWGEAPYFCEWWISRDIILQHLYSPAMWAIFQMQDLLGISPKLSRENPHEERINDPSNSEASWRYRLHINMEDLLKEDEFNNEVKNFIEQSGR
ncbi:MAG: 4-alpha-glucanotransferase [Paludibacteraceae bacterium]